MEHGVFDAVLRDVVVLDEVAEGQILGNYVSTDAKLMHLQLLKLAFPHHTANSKV
jgi:hypothetical protein